MSNEPKTTDKSPDVLQALQELLFPLLVLSTEFTKGLLNLLSFLEFNLKNGSLKPAYEGDRVQRGIIGFRRISGGLMLAIACGTKPVRYVPLDKFVALIECMKLGDSANIVIQNHKTDEKEKRAQIMARVNPRCSAIHFVQGVVGKAINTSDDIVSIDAYYLPREDLASYYIAAKRQIANERELEDLIAANDGFKGYSIKIDPFDPVE